MGFATCCLLLAMYGFLCVSLVSIALWDCCFVGLLLGCFPCWWVFNSVVVSFLSLRDALCVGFGCCVCGIADVLFACVLWILVVSSRCC